MNYSTTKTSTMAKIYYEYPDRKITVPDNIHISNFDSWIYRVISTDGSKKGISAKSLQDLQKRLSEEGIVFEFTVEKISLPARTKIEKNRVITTALFADINHRQKPKRFTFHFIQKSVPSFTEAINQMLRVTEVGRLYAEVLTENRKLKKALQKSEADKENKSTAQDEEQQLTVKSTSAQSRPNKALSENTPQSGRYRHPNPGQR